MHWAVTVFVRLEVTLCGWQTLKAKCQLYLSFSLSSLSRFLPLPPLSHSQCLSLPWFRAKSLLVWLFSCCPSKLWWNPVLQGDAKCHQRNTLDPKARYNHYSLSSSLFPLLFQCPRKINGTVNDRNSLTPVLLSVPLRPEAKYVYMTYPHRRGT